MAINPSSSYVGKIDTTSDPTGYPYGKPRNITSPGDGTGTPLEAAWVSDLFGFQQALLDAGGSIVPSGTPDKVGASQYLTALLQVISDNAAAGGFGVNENPQSGNYSLVAGDYGEDNDVTVVYTGTGGHTFTGLTSASLTAQESYVYIEHRGAGLLTVDLANASDYFGPVALGYNTITLSPGEVIRIMLTDTSNVFRVG